ncbi:MAG: hypothetical protein JNL70_24435 [Saprospiraceae bacterium]|nr:hypothetical protein [Saprospiraceae bacterium]
MKKFITLLVFLATTLSLSAQVPQAICYQAVATDTRGNELVSQAIRVRLSILKGSSAGAEEWVETHSITTDGFGLFDLMIGSGTRTGGNQTVFSGIKWGADKYYLKVEMDITGGSNYVLMGTNQMISVPYALYAEKAGSAVYADTAKYSIRAGSAVYSDTSKYSIRAGSATYSDTSKYSIKAGSATYSDTSKYSIKAGTATYSDTARYAIKAGLADSSKVSNRSYYSNYTDSSRISYTSITANTSLTSRRTDTANISLYSLNSRRSDTSNIAIYALNSRRSDTSNISLYSLNSRRSDTSNIAIYALNSRRADTASYALFAQNARRSDTAQFAWLADSARRAALATRAVVADSAGKAGNASTAAFATSAGTAATALDDRDRDPTNEIQSMSFDTITNTLTLTKPNGQNDKVVFNNLPLRSPGASIDYPFGILGEAILITSNYTVPNGKTLFISAVNNPIEMTDGKMINIEPGMPIIPTGKTIRSCFCSGILIDNQKYAEPIILDFSESIFEYTVPNNYYLVLKSGTNGSRNMSFVIDGTNYDFFTGSSSSPRLVVIPAGKKIRKGLTNVGSFVCTGYLLQK